MTGSTSDIQWYIARDGQQHGPISDVEMQLFVERGHLKAADLVWRQGFSDWRPAPIVFPPVNTPAAPAQVPPPPDVTPTSRTIVAPEPEPQPEATRPTQAMIEQPRHVGSSVNTVAPSHAVEPSAKDTGSKDAAASGKVDRDTASEDAAAKDKAAKETVAFKAVPSPVAPSPAPVGSGPKLAEHATVEPIARPSSIASGSQLSNAYAGPKSQQTLQEPEQPSPYDVGHQPRQPTIKAPLRRRAADGSGTPSDGLNDSEAPQGSGRAMRLALAGVLVAMIVGSVIYLVSHKEEIMRLAGIAEPTKGIPVVKAKPPAAAPPARPAAQVEPVKPPTPAAAPAAAPAPPPAAPAPGDNAVAPSQSATMTPTAAQVPAVVAPPTQPPAPDPARVAIDERYQKSRLWSFMKREHPQWYDEQIGAVAKLASENRPTRDATQHMVEAMVALRRSNAETALKADTAKLRGIASAFLANLQALSKSSADVCYGFVSQGETSPKIIDLFDQQPAATSLEAQAIAIFEAISAGKTAPANHDRPKKEDYDVLASELGKIGWSQADLQLFADPKALAKAPPDRVCKMVREWFAAHIAISDGAVQERLLFETLRPVVAG